MCREVDATGVRSVHSNKEGAVVHSTWRRLMMMLIR